MQCNYNSFIQIINFHGLFRNAPRCRKTGACRILVPFRYLQFYSVYWWQVEYGLMSTCAVHCQFCCAQLLHTKSGIIGFEPKQKVWFSRDCISHLCKCMNTMEIWYCSLCHFITIISSCQTEIMTILMTTVFLCCLLVFDMQGFDIISDKQCDKFFLEHYCTCKCIDDDDDDIRLRARRVLMLFIDDLLRTRKAQSLCKV